MTPDIHAFQEHIWAYYSAHGRADLPWRQPAADGSFNAYHIMVSELMLQQTQVARVVPKFVAFIAQFPTVELLAAAPLSAVLTAWSGLGYNRRAKFLWQASQAIVADHGGVVPRTPEALVSLPGIGPNTAGAILTYAFNEPHVFIETNIRTVFIHHFFADETKVSDAQLLPYIQVALPYTEARDWYWALMDYGTHLKQTVGNRSRDSATYAKQSTFEGSRRQIRGYVLRQLTAGPHNLSMLVAHNADERLPVVLQELINEGFIQYQGDTYQLAD